VVSEIETTRPAGGPNEGFFFGLSASAIGVIERNSGRLTFQQLFIPILRGSTGDARIVRTPHLA
jgi:hypothetical protein